eukprot:6222939-Lingulodinium_polyedra.AAC.1
MLGRRVDGPEQRILVRSRRFWRVWHGLGELLRRRRLAGSAARRLAGHLVDMLSIRPELVACLFMLYRFVGAGDDELREIPAALRVELRVVRGLLPLSVADLSRRPNPRAYCSDSSGY